jgi:hypothetical protein
MTDWNAKGRMFGKLKFRESEVDFLNKFGSHSTFNADNSYYISFAKNSLRIYRLHDDWYLIANHTPDGFSFPRPENFKYYICDEWEEVIGYLTTSDQFK